MRPSALVLQAVGTNRDLDAIQALELAGAEAVRVPLNDLRRGKVRWADFQMLVLPGGFSYGDAMGAGKLLAIDLISYFNTEIQAFVGEGKPVIGICNGFQALVKSGILPGPAGPRATLTFNARGHFECRWVRLLPVSQRCIWTAGLENVIECPVAHGEGNFRLEKISAAVDMKANDQLALLYAGENGRQAGGVYPANPNGSIMDIAGVCNREGTVLGLMPHPENHITPYQHPHWTRGEVHSSGLPLFENGVAYAAQL